ncbi:protein RRNAD1-like [Aedes aegypti]|uniref:Methyltransferase domain-containing protein n=1 Tax=Aedes aegypti TaxID=7159 RepID=A0A6I8U7L6_AEDAE|nr:protein RRNAD1-like [Aedes aegypti]
MIMNNDKLIAELKQKLQDSSRIVGIYSWLIDSYVLDFYVDNHWERLPTNWKLCFDGLDIRKLRDLLNEAPQDKESHVWPLSVLALRVLFRKYCLTRNLPTQEDNLGAALEKERTRFQAQHKLFNKSVKLKKRHEIEKFGEQCWRTGRKTNVQHLVDIGSGQGNLARTLCYGFGFKVCCIEQDQKLIESARQKDEELSSRLKRQLKFETMHHPIHLSKKVNLEEIDPSQFVKMVRDAFNVEKDVPFQFGLVGLHPCGDLAVFLMKLFLSCPEAKFIKLVCCCYMKLSTVKDKCSNFGFPTSAFCKQSGLHLSYEAREIACHAIEQYCNKLGSDYEELKVHAFRAAAEKIIVKFHPQLKHSGLRSTKVSDLSFAQYCEKATSGMGLELPESEIESTEVRTDLSHWERVVKFYTLRLMFAPLIESIVLYDRWLYLLEQGIHSEIDVIFDPVCSPRNHALTGEK